jgi:transcriptional regulator with XRE-family HTH domain
LALTNASDSLIIVSNMLLTISPALRRAIFERRMQGERQYLLALRLGLNPSFVSHILNGSLPVRHNDPRVLRLAEAVGISADQAFAVLGLKPDECFKETDRVKAS